MARFTKESLEELKHKVDLIEVLSPYVQLKRAGGSYKALCPFHQEKSPSFQVQRGDAHYHCFGCGAHGDAIAFLMNFLKLSFSESIEFLAEKFHVALEYQQMDEGPQVKTAPLKEAMNRTKEFFHFHLLHTDEGHAALQYLYERAIDLDFIRTFQVGFAPKNEDLTIDFFRESRFSLETLVECGLVRQSEGGWVRSFFGNRITFPILDISGNAIGFSGRKIHEETFGGKYINTPETVLFKKSHVLFGLHYSRRQIAKEKKAIIVEGQIDCLRLIQEGIQIVVAGQGTAFGADHVRELLKLGISHAFLAFDGDNAGQEAMVKVGQLFQKEGVEVSIVLLPEGMDPDSVLKAEGLPALERYIAGAIEYITFLVRYFSKQLPTETPAGKNELARRIGDLLRDWNHPLMVHEGFKKLAELLHVPESVIVPLQVKGALPPPEPKPAVSINPDRILETDFLRWLILVGDQQPPIIELAKINLKPEDLIEPLCRQLYALCLECIEEAKPLDLITLASSAERGENSLFDDILLKKVNLERAQPGIIETIGRILNRNWMLKREEIKTEIQKGAKSEAEILELAKLFDSLNKTPPKVEAEIL